LTFHFSGNFARDMSYSIAWALFALLLLIVGIRKRNKAARYASLALLGFVLLKLFFHDLSQLQQLYRIVALIVVAIIAILASFLSKRRCLSQPAQIWPLPVLRSKRRLERTSSSPCGWKDQTIKKTGERSARAILFLGWATARQDCAYSLRRGNGSSCASSLMIIARYLCIG